MVRAIVAGLAAIFLVSAVPAHAEIVKMQSPYSVAETVDRLENAIKGKGLTVFARIDHAAGAKAVGQELRPTLLIIFGSAKVGTPLIQAQQTMGLSLPLKALAWEEADGKVWLGYDAPADMAATRGIPRDHKVIGAITGALDGLTNAAIKK